MKKHNTQHISSTPTGVIIVHAKGYTLQIKQNFHVPVERIAYFNPLSNDPQTTNIVTDITDIPDNKTPFHVTVKMPPECFAYFYRLAQNGQHVDLRRYTTGLLGYENRPLSITRDSEEYRLMRPFMQAAVSPEDIVEALKKRNNMGAQVQTGAAKLFLG